MAAFEPVIEHRDQADARRMTAHVADDAWTPLCGTDVAVLHADSAEDARVPLSVHGVCLLALRARGGELAGDGRAATTVRGMLDQLDELRSTGDAAEPAAEPAPEPGPFDRLVVPDIGQAHLPGVRAITARMAAIVETHNEMAAAVVTRRDLGDDVGASSAAQSCERLRAQLDTLVLTAREVADAETRMLAPLDRLVDEARANAEPFLVGRDADAGHLRCLQGARTAIVTALHDARTQVHATR